MDNTFTLMKFASIALCGYWVFQAHKQREKGIAQLPEDKKGNSGNIRVVMTNSICIFGCLVFGFSFVMRSIHTLPRWGTVFITVAGSLLLLALMHNRVRQNLERMDLPTPHVRDFVHAHAYYGIGILLFCMGSFLF